MISKTPEIKLFKSASSFDVCIRPVFKTFKLEQEKYDLLKNMHLILIQQLILFKSDFEATNGGMIVFLKKNSNNNVEIDWDFLNQSQAFQTDLRTYLINNNNETSKLETKLFKLKMNGNRFLKFKTVETKLNPLSLFKKADSTLCFKDYFKQNYDIETQDEDQPLVELSTINIQKNFISKTKKLKKTKPDKELPYRELFICEHVIILPFESTQLIMLQMLPVIFYRTNCLLKLKILKNLIENQICMDLKINTVSRLEYIDLLLLFNINLFLI